jgi:predicted ATPase
VVSRAGVHERDAVEADLRRALEIARQQEALSLQLRAARDLATLWAERGERQRAEDLLAPTYGAFTEGFDTLDLVEARTLLDELRNCSGARSA